MPVTKGQANFFTDNPDIAFHLNTRVDFNELFAALSKESRDESGCSNGDEYRAMILSMSESVGELCGSEIAPQSAKVEQEPITLKNGEVTLPPTVSSSLEKLLAIGCASLGVSTKYGGGGMPFLPETIAHEMIMRSCPSTGLNVVWYSSIAHVIDLFGNQEIKNSVIPKIASGEWSGSMALTEADAGSDLGALKTYGEEQKDGTWRLFGSKRFISNGSGQVCLVLGKNAKGAEGLENLNLYLCLRKIDGRHNYKVTRIEDKMGLHGSATCELTFDGSTALLLGRPNQGFQHMLKLMNDARIAVGFQGVGNMEAIWRATTDYCLTRKSWGKPLLEHEMVAEKLFDMEVDLRAARSLCYQASYHQSMMYLWEAQLSNASLKLSDDERTALEAKLAKTRSKVRYWTPLIKWYVAERCVDMAKTSLQLHGGYGYTKEYRAEWWLRESLILPLYEGTSQIQALMCIKDALKEVVRQPRRFFEATFGLRVQTLSASDGLRKKLLKAKQVERGALLAILLKLIKSNLSSSLADVRPTDLIKMVKVLSRDFAKMENVGPALLHAERVCEIRAIVALASSLVKDAEADGSRRIYAERFLQKHWARLVMLKTEIENSEFSVHSYLQHTARSQVFKDYQVQNVDETLRKSS